jgi:hypothetical protein
MDGGRTTSVQQLNLPTPFPMLAGVQGGDEFASDGGTVPVKRVTSFIRRSNIPADTSADRSSTAASVADA